jgi:ribonucleoside-diphosphate reductase alpha chain
MRVSLSPNATVVVEKRYLKKDANGRIVETPEAMFERVAQAVARADALFDPKADVGRTGRQFLEMLGNLWFLPNSPTLMNAGRRLGQLAACFVLPVDDSMESIFETLKHTAIIHKSGGGTGFSFSRIRPANDTVMSTAGVSSGPLSFMGVYDLATETVKQGGTRRGANMGVLRVDHPDIEAFINAKKDPGRLNNFNISVALTDVFLEALRADKSYGLVNPRTGETVGQMPARRIFDNIVRSAWQSGEPGVIFIDRINRANPTPQLGTIESTNPCGEQPLLPYESCTLGSINLAAMVAGGRILWNRLRQTVHRAVHFLDNVIEVNKYPLVQIEKMSKATRKIGLGVMGFADMLIRLAVAYDSPQAEAMAGQVMAFVSSQSKKASAALAQCRGNFPGYAKSVYDDPATPFMRHATTTTIAPTGTISIIAGVSSGIEPIFAVSHVRQVLDGRRLPEMHPLFVQTVKKQGLFTKTLIDEVARAGSVQHIARLPDAVKALFKTSHEIDPHCHIRIQAAFQKFTDNAVSKTVNFPSHATVDDVAAAYLLADQMGCKGITVYRYGSREHQVLSLGKDKVDGTLVEPRPRPQRTQGYTQRTNTGCGRLYVTVNRDDEGICEVFAQMGKTGGCASSQIEATGRLISLALRSGVKPEAIIKQIKGIRCPSPAWQNGDMILSCPDAIAHVLMNTENLRVDDAGAMLGVCPECGGVLVHEEGCLNCHGCGFSKCG